MDSDKLVGIIWIKLSVNKQLFNSQSQKAKKQRLGSKSLINSRLAAIKRII